MKSAVFRADGSVQRGAGHAMRCLTLARALAGNDWHCEFWGIADTLKMVPAIAASGFRFTVLRESAHGDLARGPNGDTTEDLLVVDHYDIAARAESAARRWARSVMVIDDLADRPHDCDLLLDQTHGRSPQAYRDLVPVTCRVLTGAAYALLGAGYRRARRAVLARRDRVEPVARVLVSVGAGDPDCVTPRVIEALAICAQDLEVDVVLAAASPAVEPSRAALSALRRATLHTDVVDMLPLMAHADLAIGAGGTTSWERCCLGLPAITITTAANQRAIVAALEDAGAIVSLGWHSDATTDQIAESIAAMISNPGRCHAISLSARAICDGRGAERATAVIDAL